MPHLTLEQKRKFWAQATPGPLKAIYAEVFDANDSIVGDFEFMPSARPGSNLEMAPNAQRFADSTHLETLVAALEKIQGLASIVEDEPVGLLYTARDIASGALNSLNDPPEVKS